MPRLVCVIRSEDKLLASHEDGFLVNILEVVGGAVD
jgi:hypothetical protein